MSEKAHYFRIGLFVMITASLLVIAIVILGAGALFHETVLCETYIDESIQGLEIGSPVKYRGLKIGKTEEILFVRHAYDTKARYVMIRFTMDPKAIERIAESPAQERQNVLDEEIKEGLRIRWNPQGITGVAYLEIDYLDPEDNPEPPIDWEPEYYYLPSALSTFTRLSSAVEDVFARIKSADIEGIMQNLDALLVSLKDEVDAAMVAHVSEETVSLLKEARETVGQLQRFLSKPEMDTIPAEASKALAEAGETFAGARRIVENTEEDIAEIMKDLREVSQRLDKITAQLSGFMENEETRRSLANLSQSAESLKAASEELPEAIAQWNRALRRIDGAVSRQQQDIDAIFENIRQITEHLKELTGYARKYPSHVLFGEPPAPSETKK